MGEPYSTFSEIIGKYFKKYKNLKKNNPYWEYRSFK